LPQFAACPLQAARQQAADVVSNPQLHKQSFGDAARTLPLGVVPTETMNTSSEAAALVLQRQQVRPGQRSTAHTHSFDTTNRRQETRYVA